MLVLDEQTTPSEYVLIKQTCAKALVGFHHTYSPRVVWSSRSTSQYVLSIYPISVLTLNLLTPAVQSLTFLNSNK